MIRITNAAAHATPEGWPVLMIEWEGGPGARQVVESHPIIWRNGMVAMDDESLELPDLIAFQVPSDETSGTLTVSNALNAPQAAAIAMAVFGGDIELTETPAQLEIPAMADALKTLREK